MKSILHIFVFLYFENSFNYFFKKNVAYLLHTCSVFLKHFYRRIHLRAFGGGVRMGDGLSSGGKKQGLSKLVIQSAIEYLKQFFENNFNYLMNFYIYLKCFFSFLSQTLKIIVVRSFLQGTIHNQTVRLKGWIRTP